MTEKTESQQAKIDSLGEELGGVSELGMDDNGIVTIELPDGSKIQVGRRGGVREVGSEAPLPAQTPADPASEGSGDAVVPHAEPAPQPEPPSEDELTQAALELAESEVEEIPAPQAEPEALASDAPADYMPRPADLEVRGPDDVFRAFDRADEVAILEQLQGNMLDTYVYSFESGGRMQTDLSVIGVNECIRLLNNTGKAAIQISREQPAVREFSEGGVSYVEVMVAAEDPLQNRREWGVATEPKHMERRDGTTVWDKFAMTKALNKAQRNAKRAHIPEEFRRVMIGQFLGQGRVGRLNPVGAGDVAELPPPLTDERSEELRAEIRELFQQIREVNPLAMAPGMFNAMLTRSEWDHQRLEEMKEHMAGLLANQRKALEEASNGTAS